MKRGIKDLPEFKRPREKLVERGPEALTDAELLAILLRTGVEGKSALDLARSILKKTGPELPRWSVKELAQIPKVGMAKACEIVAAFELARRFLQGKRPTISKPEDVLPYVQDFLDRKQEYFVVLTLTGANEVITRKVVTVGLLGLSPSSSREVFAEAITGFFSFARKGASFLREYVPFFAKLNLGVPLFERVSLWRMRKNTPWMCSRQKIVRLNPRIMGSAR